MHTSTSSICVHSKQNAASPLLFVYMASTWLDKKNWFLLSPDWFILVWATHQFLRQIVPRPSARRKQWSKKSWWAVCFLFYLGTTLQRALTVMALCTPMLHPAWKWKRNNKCWLSDYVEGGVRQLDALVWKWETVSTWAVTFIFHRASASVDGVAIFAIQRCPRPGYCSIKNSFLGRI